jgi:hypothetical protein
MPFNFAANPEWFNRSSSIPMGSVLRAFSGGGPDFTSGANLTEGTSSGGGRRGMVIDPATAIFGGLNAVTSAVTGFNQAGTTANIAQAKLAAQRAGTLERRQMGYGQLGAGMWSPLFQAGAGGDIAFGREREARMFETGPLAERERAQQMDAFRSRLGAESSAEAKALKQFQAKEDLRKSIAERTAAMDRMFGPTSQRAFV